MLSATSHIGLEFLTKILKVAKSVDIAVPELAITNNVCKNYQILTNDQKVKSVTLLYLFLLSLRTICFFKRICCFANSLIVELCEHSVPQNRVIVNQLHETVDSWKAKNPFPISMMRRPN